MAKKKKKVFFCDECGYDSLSWLGKCPACGVWNSFKEMTIDINSSKKSFESIHNRVNEIKITELNNIDIPDEQRLSLGSSEFDRVLGGGVCFGATVLFVGEPGIGKSTLLLKAAANVTALRKKVLYFSAEEALSQIKSRALRIGIVGDNLFVVNAVEIDEIIATIKKIQPDFVIVDSIQAVYDSSISSAAGSVSQVREVSLRLADIARNNGFALFLIGHVTKDGLLAGPRTLEHMVDVVVYFEGDRYESLRIIRSVKNRYGPTGEVGIFEMTSSGLLDVENPSNIFLPDFGVSSIGRATIAVMEGRRPFLLDVQALTNHTSFNNPLRRALGIEVNKISLLLAVMEKNLKVSFANSDVFVKAVGGLSLREPAIDLGLVIALLSAYTMKPVDLKTVYIGEVGLSGEVRKVRFLEERIKEAHRLGFKKVIIPNNNLKKKLGNIDISIEAIKNIVDCNL